MRSTKRVEGIDKKELPIDEHMGDSNKDLGIQLEEQKSQAGDNRILGKKAKDMELLSAKEGKQYPNLQNERITREIMSYRDKLLDFNRISSLDNDD